jgi:hypothetical protein
MQATGSPAMLVAALAIAVWAPAACCSQKLRPERAEGVAAGATLGEGDLFPSLLATESRPGGWATPVNFLSDDGACAPICGDRCEACDANGPVCECGCSGGCCAQIANKPNPCATSHQGVFYANDFSYLLEPDYHGHCLGDCWKLMPVGCCGEYGTLDVGGQLRMRYHHEVGMGQDVAGPGVNRFEDTVHDFVLARLRLYTNWKPNDDVGTYLPRFIDRNFGDFLNLFIDVTVADGLIVRVGRQELLYGEQRLISPLDWANTRRTFEGVKVMMKEGDWAVDGFYTYFVPVVPNELDEADYDQAFYGTYATYAGFENKIVDLYYIGYDNQNPGAITSDFSLHTLGARLAGERCDWLYDMEGGVQFGRQSGLGVDQNAGFATVGLGRRMSHHAWKPTLWCYYDYASGDATGGDFNRFNQLFPLSHKYFGFIDAVQRSNIESPNLLLTMKPHQKWDFLLWYWHFMANQETDIVPSNGGTPTESTSSKDFGDELDVLVKYTIDARSNVLVGWSHFWRGNKITAPEDADFFYCQWELNF